MRRVFAVVSAFLLPLIVIPTALMFGYIRAEWALAFGKARIVSAAVTGSSPSFEFNRTCGAMIQINVVWPAPAGTQAGHFTVCDNDGSQFPVGRIVQVAVFPGDASVIYGENRTDAIGGVVIESVFGAFFLIFLGLMARWWLVLGAARARLRTAPWLSGEMQERAVLRPSEVSRGDPFTVFFDPGSIPWSAHRDPMERKLKRALPPLREDSAEVAAARRKDGVGLSEGDRVWVAPTGRSLIRRRRTQPYAIVRASDRALFWGTGKPLPGGW